MQLPYCFLFIFIFAVALLKTTTRNINSRENILNVEQVTEELSDKRYFFPSFSQMESRHFAKSFIAPDFFFF